MTVYVAVDFHARDQVVSWCDTADGEGHRTKLRHQHDDVRKFYEQFNGEVIVGFEASGYSAWFEQMLAELEHTIWLGNPAEIRRKAPRRQKNDRRDADLMLDLMLKGAGAADLTIVSMLPEPDPVEGLPNQGYCSKVPAGGPANRVLFVVRNDGSGPSPVSTPSPQRGMQFERLVANPDSVSW